MFNTNRILKNSNAADLIPIRIHSHEIDQNGLVTILVPKFKKTWISNFLKLKDRSRFIHIELDELGTATWLAIDGVKSIGLIVSELNDKLGQKIYPAEERVVKFINGLYNNRYITFKQLLDK